jgi:hypothetical protein
MASTLLDGLALQLGALSSPPGILAALVVIAIVIIVGRIVLSVAWKLVWIAIAVVGLLWVLGVLGAGVGIF